MRAIIGVTIAATKKIFHFIYLYNILYYLHIDHKYPNYIIGHQKIRWGVILPKNRTNTDRPKSVITYNLSKNSSDIPKLSSSYMYSMTSNCCSFFFGLGVLSQTIGLCSFVGFFGGFGSLDMSSLKACCLSKKAKFQFSASPILLFIHSLQLGGNGQPSFKIT